MLYLSWLLERLTSNGACVVKSQLEFQPHLNINILPVMSSDLVQPAGDAFPFRVSAEGVFEP